MKVTISFKNLEHTESLDERIKQKSLRMEKFWEGKVEVKWTCWVSGGEHFAEVSILGPKVDYHAKAKSDDLYKSLDLVINKIEKQVYKSKTKIKDKIHRPKAEIIIHSPSEAWGDFEAYQEEMNPPTPQKRRQSA